MVQSSKDQDLQSSFLVFEEWLFQLSVKPLKLETHGASAAVTSGMTVSGGGKPSAGHCCLAPFKSNWKVFIHQITEFPEFPILASIFEGVYPLYRIEINAKQSHLAVSLTQQKALQLPQP